MKKLKRSKIALSSFLVAGILMVSCSSNRTGQIVVYNGQHLELTQALVSSFEKSTGISVKLETNSSVVLADQLLEEGSHTRADVIFLENSPEMMLVEQHNLLRKLSQSTLAQIPSKYSSPQGDWVGVALRVSCLAYNPSLIASSALPTSLLDLAKPYWKGKLALAPSDPDFLPLVGAIARSYSVQQATAWLNGLRSNGSLYQSDEAALAAVNQGRSAIGIINQYYWYRLRLQDGPSRMHSKLYFFPNENVGSLENISPIAISRYTSNYEASIKFVNFVISHKGESLLARSDDYEYPARVGVNPNSLLEPLSRVSPDLLSVVQLGNDKLAAKLVSQAGLL